MASALLVRFRPAGPWRLGPGDGARSHTDRIFHSDSLYSAVTTAMRDLGWVSEWLAVTAEAGTAAVRLTSCYPYTPTALLITPPRSVWPPVQSGRLRWKAAKFIPVKLVGGLLRGEEIAEDSWAIDPWSECLLPITRSSAAVPPFRLAQRASVPVDRVTGSSGSAERAECLEFLQGAGMWCAAAFTDEETRRTWMPRVRSAFLYLADTGIGGGRSRGWGRSLKPRFEDVDLQDLLTAGTPATEDSGETAWWMVSMFSPADGDQVDWERGNYTSVARSGRLESRTSSGSLKAASPMISEGSVLLAGAPPSGAARNVADSEDMPHPVYRSGIAVAVPVPWRQRDVFAMLHEKTTPVEATATTTEPEEVTPAEDPEGAQPESEAFPPVPEQEPDGAATVAQESVQESEASEAEPEKEPEPSSVPNEANPEKPDTDAFPPVPGQEPDGAAPIAPDEDHQDRE